MFQPPAASLLPSSTSTLQTSSHSGSMKHVPTSSIPSSSEPSSNTSVSEPQAPQARSTRPSPPPSSSLAAWYGSEYLSANGTVLSRKETEEKTRGSTHGDDSNSTAPTRPSKQSSSSSSSNPNPSRRQHEKEKYNTDGNDSPRLELSPSYVIAPTFPHMGMDALSESFTMTGGTGGWMNPDGTHHHHHHHRNHERQTSSQPHHQLNFYQPSFAGWQIHSGAHQHDQPLLRFLPDDERVDQYKLQPVAETLTASKAQLASMMNGAPSASSNSPSIQPTPSPSASPPIPRRQLLAANLINASATGATASSVANPDDDDDRIRPIQPRVSSARGDPKYSPSLLKVTEQWWASCATSHFLTSTPSTAAMDPTIPSPPILAHSPYVQIRMLICMALLPNQTFEQRLPSLAKMVEQDFLEESASGEISGLTLPMFHTSLCQLASSWTNASTVEQYSEFLGNLYESITEEVEDARNASSLSPRSHLAKTTQLPFSPKSPISSPTSPSGGLTNRSQSNHNDKLLSVSPAVIPRRFKRLPSPVLTALALAADEVASERERDLAAASSSSSSNVFSPSSGSISSRKPAATTPFGAGSATQATSSSLRRKKEQRERNEVKEAMAKRSEEMIRMTKQQSSKSKKSSNSRDDTDSPRHHSPSKPKKRKEPKDQDTSLTQSSGTCDNDEDDDDGGAEDTARAERLATKKKEKKLAAEEKKREKEKKQQQASLNARLKKESESLQTLQRQSSQESNTSSLAGGVGDEDEEESSLASIRSTGAISASGSSSRSGGGVDSASQRSRPNSPPSLTEKKTAPSNTNAAAPSPRKYMSASEIRAHARHTVEDRLKNSGGGGGGGANATTLKPSTRSTAPSNSMTTTSGLSQLKPQRSTSDSSTSQPRSALRTFPSNSSGGGGDGEEDDGTESSYLNEGAVGGAGSSRVSSASRGGRSESRATVGEEEDQVRTELMPSSSSSPSTQPQHPQPASLSKQARIQALQQQALMHRARISTGRTHSGHVLPAYQTVSSYDEPPQSFLPIQHPAAAPYAGAIASTVAAGQSGLSSVPSSSSFTKPSGYTYSSTITSSPASSGIATRYLAARSSHLHRDDSTSRLSPTRLDALASQGATASSQLARLQETTSATQAYSTNTIPTSASVSLSASPLPSTTAVAMANRNRLNNLPPNLPSSTYTNNIYPSSTSSPIVPSSLTATLASYGGSGSALTSSIQTYLRSKPAASSTSSFNTLQSSHQQTRSSNAGGGASITTNATAGSLWGSRDTSSSVNPSNPNSSMHIPLSTQIAGMGLIGRKVI